MAYSFGNNFMLVQHMRRSFLPYRLPSLLLPNGVDYFLLPDTGRLNLP